jgi:RNA polymerase sigma-70 factor (ECF subfamily)
VDSDETLYRRIREGDLAAFDVLYDRHEGRLFGYLCALVGDRRDAEELLHDAFLSSLKTGTTSFDEGGFRAWLFRIARNLAFNRKRAAGRRERAHAALPDGGEATAADSALESRQLDAALERAVGRLPPMLGELFHLRSSGLSYEQIATVTDAPIGTIKSRMHQMVHALREELRPWIAPE